MRFAALLLLAGCATTSALPTASDFAAARARSADVKPAIAKLETGDLDATSKELQAVLQKDSGHPEALAVRALVDWIGGTRDLASDLRTAILGAMLSGRVSDAFYASILQRAPAMLEKVDASLARASESRALYFELTPALIQLDWNMNGGRDRGDERLLEVELDANGEELPDEDPRRRPTFAFDHGDLAWARAMIAFQRAAVDVIAAYRWTALQRMFNRSSDRSPVRIELDDASRIKRAREHILAGLAFARAARSEYLAEVDDDREWVPNPKQKSHAIPLPVDGALYATWLAILDDIDRLLRGDEGLELRPLIAAIGARDEDNDARGFLDVRALFDSPQPIVLDPESAGGSLGKLVDGVFGPAVKAQMKPSLLTERLTRMQREITAGNETWAKKLRYLIWLN